MKGYDEEVPVFRLDMRSDCIAEFYLAEGPALPTEGGFAA
jgi:hypothetical protein